MYINNKDIKTKIMKAIAKNKYKIVSGSQNELVINSFCNEFSYYLWYNSSEKYLYSVIYYYKNISKIINKNSWIIIS